MTFHGRVRNGVIVLDPPAALPKGAEVEVVTLAPGLTGPTWDEVFKDFIGKAEGLPSDAARQHDHYLYGAPKE